MLTERYHQAVAHAVQAHAGQVRKGTTIPYISHPLAVSPLVLEFGGDEDQAIAAELHDVLEDCGAAHAPLIEKRFGARVLALVEGCTDGHAGEKAPWRERKEADGGGLDRSGFDGKRRTRCSGMEFAAGVPADTLESCIFRQGVAETDQDINVGLMVSAEGVRDP